MAISTRTTPDKTEPTGRDRSVRHFLQHLGEMVLAMLAGMLLLGPIWEAVGSALGATDALGRTDVRVAEASVTMVAAMAAWMLVRRHRWREISEMAAAMTLPYLVLLTTFWWGALSGDAVLHGGHLLMVPAMVVAMVVRRDAYLRHRPLRRTGTAGSGIWVALRRRWPAGLALLLTLDYWLVPTVPNPWILLVLPLGYLVIGSWRRQLGHPGMLAAQLAGLAAYVALLLVVLSVDDDLARYLVAAGWLAHAAWDLVHLRLNRVVPRPYAEFCAVLDTVIGITIIVLL